MRKFFLISIVNIICFYITCIGQPLIHDADSLDYFFVSNTDTLYQVNIAHYAPRKKRERDRLFYLNSVLFDSTGINFRYNPYRYETTFRGYQVNSFDYIYKIYSFKIGQSLDRIMETPKYVPMSYHFGVNPDSSKNIYSIKKLGEVDLFASLEPYLSYIEVYRSSEEIWKIHELSKDKILCESCAWGGGCTLYRYFVIRKDVVEEINFNQLRQPYKNRFEPQYEDFRVNFYFSHYDYNFLMAAIDYGNLPANTDLLFSEDLEDTTHVIKKHQTWEIMGENIQQSENQYFYLRSRLDGGEEVIVSYKMDKAFEKVAYQIFKGHLISKDQVKTFNKEQLGILKNLAFAKYNYAFNSDFYQAYFNLFEFYNDEKERASRTKDMTGLLTGADTKNLQVIRKALEKFD